MRTSARFRVSFRLVELADQISPDLGIGHEHLEQVAAGAGRQSFELDEMSVPVTLRARTSEFLHSRMRRSCAVS
jgi:hypothetical protein